MKQMVFYCMFLVFLYYHIFIFIVVVMYFLYSSTVVFVQHYF